MVSEERARAIAVAVLDQGRSFPNAIVLATDGAAPPLRTGAISFAKRPRFLVVDGQHRLAAQRFSKYDASYCCLIHFDLDERAMAELFVEINDNQKRVPASLRWDLVRLVRADEDSGEVRAADLVYALATTRGSALYQRVDLTGEQKAITLKQGSLAPGIKYAVSGQSPLSALGYDIQLRILRAYFAAIRECDADGWSDGTSVLYAARVLRALLRLLPDLLRGVSAGQLAGVDSGRFYSWLKRVSLKSLDPEKIRAQQGAAGIKAIYETLRGQVLKS